MGVGLQVYRSIEIARLHLSLKINFPIHREFNLENLFNFHHLFEILTIALLINQIILFISSNYNILTVSKSHS